MLTSLGGGEDFVGAGKMLCGEFGTWSKNCSPYFSSDAELSLSRNSTTSAEHDAASRGAGLLEPLRGNANVISFLFHTIADAVREFVFVFLISKQLQSDKYRDPLVVQLRLNRVDVRATFYMCGVVMLGLIWFFVELFTQLADLRETRQRMARRDERRDERRIARRGAAESESSPS